MLFFSIYYLCKNLIMMMNGFQFGFNDTVACRVCERDGVGEPGTPRGVSQARVARRIRGTCASIHSLHHYV